MKRRCDEIARQAESEAKLAKTHESIAESRALAAQALETLNRDQAAALNLAVKAWQTAHASEANNAVVNSFSQASLILQGHTDRVTSAVFSPDGQRIVAASYDQTARVFRVVTLSEIAELLAK